jgi:hypothetical protein
MAQPKPNDRSNPVRRDHDRRGMRLVRTWVPDPRTPAFRAEAARQAALLRGAPEDEEALRFIEAAAPWPDA